MQDALLLSRVDLEKALDFASVLSAVEESFHAQRRGEWDAPKRIAAHTKGGGLLAMPCGGGRPEALGAKLVSTFPGNSALGLPGVSGLYALFNPETGTPQAVMDGGYLTLVRTAAVSAVATRVLSRTDARTLGVLGAGAQAEFHVRLLAIVRPIDTVVIWARKREKAEALIASLRVREELSRVTSWIAASHAEDAGGCDIVVTATGALEPVLLGSWLRESAHVNAIGAHTRSSREIDTTAVTRASILAVETEDTLLTAGDFQMAEDDAGGVVSRVVTLGALLDPAEPMAASNKPHRTTIFKSCGVAFEDLAVGALAFGRARERRLGSTFSFAR